MNNIAQITTTNTPAQNARTEAHTISLQQPASLSFEHTPHAQYVSLIGLTALCLVALWIASWPYRCQNRAAEYRRLAAHARARQ
ncbi:MAG TPA: hypothetical protein VGP72_04740 [Planctomycetota bacterium]|jgi:hypothetical protein